MPRTAAPTPRTRLRRLHHKGAHDAATIAAILDASPVAHVGHLVDGAPMVTPTLHWREGDRIYWHGSSASRMIRAATDAPVCVTVTLVDGMVLARSGLEHSVNYRSVMVMGRAQAVRDPAARLRHLEVMMEALFPGRWAALRPITAQELKATAVLSLPLTEASAKLSAGMPDDPPDDLDWPVWAGVLPISTVVGPPQPDPRLAPGLALPDHATHYRFNAPPPPEGPE